MPFFGGGAKVAGPRIGEKWELWVHALAGGAHMFPQTVGKNMWGPGFRVGGGTDFRWKSWLSLRIEADLMRTQLYGQGQNNFQLVSGLVFRFWRLRESKQRGKV